MDIRLSDDANAISWPELARVIELAPLGKRDIGKLEITFRLFDPIQPAGTDPV